MFFADTGSHWTVASKGIYYFDFGVEIGEPKLLKFYSQKQE